MPVPAGSGPAPSSPSGPIYYDPVLSRVRLTLSGLSDPFTDTFSTPATGGWGPPWTVDGAATSQFLVTGGIAVHRVNALNTRFRSRTSGLSMADVDVTTLLRLDTAPAGNYIRSEVSARIVGPSSFYGLRVHVLVGGAIDLQLIRLVAGTETPLAAVAAGVTHTAGMSLHLRFNVAGTVLRGKVWRDDAPEPAGWQITATDATHTTGDVGVSTLFPPGNTNTLPYDVMYDGFTATPSINVERSTDEVRWETVRGAGGLVPSGGEVRVDDYEFAPDVANHYRVVPHYSGSIVPVIGGVWLKSIARPFLNRQVTLVDYSDVERPTRSGVFEVSGRSFPVAVTDVRGSRRWTLEALAHNSDEAADVDLLLASGDILLVHVPADCDVPGGYVAVGDSRQRRTGRLSVRRVFELPCVEVAAPGPDVVGAAGTCQTVLNTYATCQAVLDAHSTCLSLLELIGDPTDVIVG
ncbi:hypothetical protein [Micromonospora sp. URMC 103]|uniref:hypothetical protein n=1 Tax=Micromonospora sp. URMC 103 TaxID=3423406 RepID=UPI003F1CD43A